MEIDNPVNNRSNIVKWVLILTIAAIFLAIALGVGALNINSNQVNYSTCNEHHYRSRNTDLELNNMDVPNISYYFGDVPLAEGRLCYDKDTEKGWIEYNANICTFDELPLCITNDYLTQWTLTATTQGGYEPRDGYIEVIQGYGTSKEVLRGKIYYSWTYLGRTHLCPCYVDEYEATFYLEEGVYQIELDSNQWPNGAYGDNVCQFDTIPGKKVHLSTDFEWQGCSEEEQRFMYIVAQKNQSNIIPNPPNEVYNFIAGLRQIRAIK